MKVLIGKNWYKLQIINLGVIALFGMLMRYKIAFDFPFLDQKYLLHAHSHFAFSGWISQFLYLGLFSIIATQLPVNRRKKYIGLISANMICAWGMLIAFTLQGYKAVSITFSTLTIFISIFYAYLFIKDSKRLLSKHPSVPWAVTGLLLNILSSAGPFSLAYMMASNNINHELYLASVYYFLHFQYNGWFFFATMAIVVNHLPITRDFLKKYFRLFAISILPTFFLSTLWLKLPQLLYIIVVLTTIIQLYAWGAMIIKLKPVLEKIKHIRQNKWINLFYYSAVLAISIKFILQAVSVIPSLSQLVFGYRPIVIAYLHLVLLGVYSLFIIGYYFSNGYLLSSNIAKISALAFLLGVLFNELFLAVQGVSAFTYTIVPYIHEMLFGAALLLFCSATALALSQFRKVKPTLA